MDSEESWDTETRLKVYLHEYMMKKKMTITAAIFEFEAGLSNHSVERDHSEFGFLHKWWGLFWDKYFRNQSETEAAPQRITASLQGRQMAQPRFATDPQTSQQCQWSNNSPSYFDPYSAPVTTIPNGNSDPSLGPLGLYPQNFSFPPEMPFCNSSLSPQMLEHMIRQGNTISSGSEVSGSNIFENDRFATLLPQNAGLRTVMNQDTQPGLLPYNPLYNQQPFQFSPSETPSTNGSQASSSLANSVDTCSSTTRYEIPPPAKKAKKADYVILE